MVAINTTAFGQELGEALVLNLFGSEILLGIASLLAFLFIVFLFNMDFATAFIVTSGFVLVMVDEFGILDDSLKATVVAVAYLMLGLGVWLLLARE